MRTVDDTPVGFGVGVHVNLIGIVAVILVMHRQRLESRFRQVIQNTPVLTVVVTARHAYLHIRRLRQVFGGHHEARVMVVQMLHVQTVTLVLRVRH